ncbi:hypothetical protein L596_007872 [Steinernema carpocapsae]|uniref:B box-type domain-containing protein n=1 Tax=Steinernema carpocapsae TaxID=34508 RepID=A0A4U5PAP6_STECR|nr:hypothetical protein L596_007872 [Steinernema carpocapsae]
MFLLENNFRFLGSSHVASKCAANCITSSGQVATAMFHCVTCSDDLCGACTSAHRRVKLTRDHQVIKLVPFGSKGSDSGLEMFSVPSTMLDETTYSGRSFFDESDLSSEGGGTGVVGSMTCPIHQMMNACVCKTCSGEHLCVYCIRHHRGHEVVPIARDPESVLQTLASGASLAQKSLEESVKQVSRMNGRVDAATQTALWELRSWIHYYLSGVEKRNRELKEYIDVIHRERQKNLQEQSSKLELQIRDFKDALRAAESCLVTKPSSGSSCDEDVNSNAQQNRVCAEKLIELFAQFPDENELLPCEVDHIKFAPPDSSVYESIRVLGELKTSASASKSFIVGDVFKHSICNRSNSFLIQMNDPCGRPYKDSERPDITLVGPSNTFLDVAVSETEPSVLKVSYVPVVEGKYTLNVNIRGAAITGCPCDIVVRRGRIYSDLFSKGPIFSFGTTGQEDGELCRPWGICCDVKSRIIVADRSNNRIQIFHKYGKYLAKFGETGSRNGEFNRPAGVCTNSKNHIIVADKDNHRIQVFDEDGNFLLKFGERGRNSGLFNYPWDVACSSNDSIAVSDTRNHRVQIFSADGVFLKKCGFDNSFLYKHFDAPRGVCFAPDGQLLVTDFNNHRVHRLPSSASSNEMKAYGGEGQEPGLFCRPQGLAIDTEGHVLLCDSKNNRVQVLQPSNMTAVAVFGGFADRKTDVSLPAFVESDASYIISHHPERNQFVSLADLVKHCLTDNKNAGASEMSCFASGLAVLDRPCDLCVSPEGLIYVVDFGNNCVRVF